MKLKFLAYAVEIILCAVLGASWLIYKYEVSFLRSFDDFKC